MSVDADAIDFELRGDHITLDRLLKATGLAPSGGAAKALIADGGVQVDGVVELRRGRKLHAGAVVSVDGQRVTLHSAGPEDAAAQQRDAKEAAPKGETPPGPGAGGAGGFTASGAPEV